MVLTRSLNPDGYGELTLALAYLGLFTILVEGGLNMTVIRAGSQKPEELKHLLVNAFTLRCIITVIVWLVGSALVPFTDYSMHLLSLLWLAIATLLVSPLSMWRLVFLIHQEIKLVAVLDVIGQLLNTALLLGVLYLWEGSVMAVLWAFLIATLLGNMLYFIYSRHLLIGDVAIRLDWSLWKKLLFLSWPLAFTGTIHFVHNQVGRLLIGYYLSSTDGGYYSAAFGLATGLSTLPAVYFTVVYPLFARYFATDKENFLRLYQLSFRVMMIIVLPFVLLVSLAGPTVMGIYAGPAYLPAVPLMIALAWVEIFQFGGTVTYYIILAAEQQKILPVISVVLLVVRVSLLVWLLPRIGLAGTVIAALAMHLTATGIYSALSATRPYVLSWLACVWRPIIPLIFLAGFSWLIHPSSWMLWFGGLVGILLIVRLLNFDRGRDRRVLSALLSRSEIV